MPRLACLCHHRLHHDRVWEWVFVLVCLCVCVWLPCLAGLPAVISLLLGHSHSSAPLPKQTPDPFQQQHCNKSGEKSSIPLEEPSALRDTSSFFVWIPNCIAVLRTRLHCVVVCGRRRYPAYLNTRGVPVLIVNQIMIPQLHYCIVIIVTQSLHSPHSSVIELEALVSEYPSVKLSISRNTVRSVCLTFFFFSPVLSQGLLRQTWYVWNKIFSRDACIHGTWYNEQNFFYIFSHRAWCLRHPLRPCSR